MNLCGEGSVWGSLAIIKRGEHPKCFTSLPYKWHFLPASSFVVSSVGIFGPGGMFWDSQWGEGLCVPPIFTLGNSPSPHLSPGTTKPSHKEAFGGGGRGRLGIPGHNKWERALIWGGVRGSHCATPKCAYSTGGVPCTLKVCVCCIGMGIRVHLHTRCAKWGRGRGLHPKGGVWVLGRGGTHPRQRFLLVEGTLRLQGRLAGAVGEEGASYRDRG